MQKKNEHKFKTKRKGDLAFSTRKLAPQKGTGHARKGSRKAPHFRKGAKAHGPVIRDFRIGIQKRVKRLGVRVALSARASEGKLFVVDSFMLDTHKTKEMANIVELWGWNMKNKALLVCGIDKVDEKLELASRQIGCIKVIPAQWINCHDILRMQNLVLSREALDVITEKYKQ